MFSPLFTSLISLKIERRIGNLILEDAAENQPWVVQSEIAMADFKAAADEYFRC